MKIGVLSIQGGVIEHINHLKSLDVDTIEVKNEKDLDSLDGIILPGGESTTIGKIINERGLLEPLKEKIINGLPVWGTCAGMILLAKNIENENIRHLAVLDATVRRNAYGTQLNSFISKDVVKEVSPKRIPLIFIRAPYIVDVHNDTKVLHVHDNKIVAVRQKNILATSFHPELSEDLSFHKYFISMCNN